MSKIKKLNNIIIFFFFSISIFGQNEFTTKKKYYKNGKLKSEITFRKKGNKLIREGKSSFWYNTGELKNIINFKKNKLDGERISYWKNGELKRKDVFKKGKLKEGKCFDKKGNEIEYYDFEIHPEFPGGKKAFNDFIEENLVYNNSITGGKLVFIFTIEANGKVSNLKILKDTSPSLKSELIKMFKSMPIWKPAMQDGIRVKVRRTIPVNFG